MSGQGINWPVSTPGAQESAKSIKELRQELQTAQKVVEDMTPGTAAWAESMVSLSKKSEALTSAQAKQDETLKGLAKTLTDKAGTGFDTLGKKIEETTKKSKDSEKAAESWSERWSSALKNGALPFNQLTEMGSKFASIVEGLGQAAVKAEATDRAYQGLGASAGRLSAVTHGAVEMTDLFEVKNGLLASKLKFTDEQFEVLTAAARDHAVAVGHEVVPELEKLSQALKTGSADALKEYGVQVNSSDSRSEKFRKTLAHLRQEQTEGKRPAETAAESMKALKISFDEVTGAVVGSIAKLLHLKDVFAELAKDVKALPNELSQFFGTDKAQDAAEKRGALGYERTSSQGGSDFVLDMHAHRAGRLDRVDLQYVLAKTQEQIQNAIDPTHSGAATFSVGDTTKLSDEDLDKVYHQVFDIAKEVQQTQGATTGFGGSIARALHGDRTNQLREIVKNRAGALYTAVDSAIATEAAARSAQDALTNQGLREAGLSTEVTKPPGKGKGGKGKGDKGKGDKGTGFPGDGGAGGFDPAVLAEQGGALHKFIDQLKGAGRDVSALLQEDGESLRGWVIRASKEIEDELVSATDKAHKHRGEKEEELASRRVDLAREALSKLQDIEKARREFEQKQFQEASNAQIRSVQGAAEKARQLFADMQEEQSAALKMAGIDRYTLTEQSLSDRAEKGGASEVERQRARYFAAGRERDAARGKGDNATVQMLNEERAALTESIAHWNELQRAKRDAMSVDKQFANAWKSSAIANANATKSFADLAVGAYQGLAESVAAHTLAVAQNKETVLDAARAVLAETLNSIAKKAITEGTFLLFKVPADLAMGNFPGAALDATAGAGMVALGVGLGAAGAAVAPPSVAATPSASSAGGHTNLGRENAPGGGGGQSVYNITNNFDGVPLATIDHVERSTAQSVGRALRTNAPPASMTRAMRRMVGAH